MVNRFKEKDFTHNEYNPYHKLGRLRKQGFSEIFFPLCDALQAEQYRELLSKLQFYGFFYEVVEVDGAAILFMSEQAAQKLCASAMRSHVRKALGSTK